MKRPLVYDITRLVTRIFARTPNGIDRVDYAFAKYALGESHPARAGVVTTPIGPRVIPLEAAREAIGNIRKHWREDADPESDDDYLAVKRALEQPAAPKSVEVSAARRGQFGDAMVWVMRHGMPLAQLPWKFLDRGGVYLNVSQFPLWIDACFRWLGPRDDIDGVFFIHDLLPLETPEYFRAAERSRHLRRLATLARYGRAAIVSTSITRKSLLRRMALLGRPDMPVLVAPLPADPAFAASEPEWAPVRPPYFVMCGTIEPRKNHLLILHLWRDLAGALGQATPKLLLVGERGWENEHVMDLLERCPALQGYVVRASGLSTPALKRLMLGARALLMPSFAEGYGLPAVEGLAAGVPVIASDIPVFHEIGGGRLTLLGPNDGPGWREAIRRLLLEPPPIPRLSPSGNLAGLEWNDFFAGIEDFLREIAGAPVH